jgi:sterol 24-C-methyltransferase
MLTDIAARDKLAELAAQDSDAEVSQRQLTNVKKSRRPKRLRRMETALRSFRVLKSLTKEQVDNFMNSYIIYDLDWADEEMMRDTLGPDYQKRVGDCLRDYYSVLNHMCAIGELEKMYIPPVMDLHVNLITNQSLYEESIAQELQLPDHPRVLDLGCGRGRVAAHMTLLTGARVTGLNIDHDQVASAIAFNKQRKFSNNFIRADFNDLPLPLPDNEFDGFYQIQAFSLCKDIPKLCEELYRVLKPGAKLSLLDWAQLDAFDPDNTNHQKLMRKIKPLIGAVGTPTPTSLAHDLESAGFKVLRTNNASIDGLQSPLIERADGYFRAARFALLGLVRVGILPAHFRTLFNRFTQDCDAFVEADRARLITTSYHWLAEKPTDPPIGRTISKTSPMMDAAVKPEPLLASESTGNPSLPAAINILAKTESLASSDRTTQSSVASLDAGVQSPSSARSESTGITLPTSEPHATEKTEPLSVNHVSPLVTA